MARPVKKLLSRPAMGPRDSPFVNLDGVASSAMRTGRFSILMAGFLVLAVPDATTGAAQARVALFGADERRSERIELFPQWTGALERYFVERELAEGSCEATSFNRCHLREWRAFLDGIRGRSRAEQLRLVNDFHNSRRYIIDPVNYQVPDYWASPREFFQNEGDCEDYAIAKYLSLRALGWSPSELRILVLQDENLGIGHAVLIVYTGGTAMVLDNQIDEVVDHRRIRHYRPIYSINERAWWVHRINGQVGGGTATPGATQ